MTDQNVTPVQLDKELVQEVKISAAMLGTTIKAIVEKSLRRFLREFDDGLITKEDFKKDVKDDK